MITSKTLCATLLATSLPFSSLRMAHAQITLRVPPTKGIVTPSQKAATTPSPFDSLAAKYLSGIDRVTKERQNLLLVRYKSERDEAQKLDSEMAAKESQILVDWRAEAAKRPEKKLLFLRDSPEQELLNPFSVTAARIVTSLNDEGLINPSGLYRLFHNAESLSPQWLNLFKKLQEGYPKNSEEWDIGAELLFKANADREKYKGRLTTLAEQGNATALQLLLFGIDEETGEKTPVISPENFLLMRRITAKSLASNIVFYASKLVCAQYALLLRDYSLAQAICDEIYNLNYVSQDDSESETDSDKDMLVFDAKRKSLEFLFYEVKNEKALKTVYDRSRIVQIESELHEAVLPQGLASMTAQNWMSYSAYPTGRLEIDFAQTLIASVQNFSK